MNREHIIQMARDVGMDYVSDNASAKIRASK